MVLSLATADQLRARLQNPGLDAAAAQQAIDDAGNWIRSLSGQDVDFATTTVDLIGGGRDLELPQSPVVVDDTHPLTVQESVDGGQVWAVTPATTFRRVGQVLRRRVYTQWRPAFPQWPTGGSPAVAGVWAPDVRVTYSHGYLIIDDVPPVLTSICLDAASVLVSNPEGLRTEQVGGISITWATESLQAPAALVETISKKLRAARFGRAGAFSMGATT